MCGVYVALYSANCRFSEKCHLLHPVVNDWWLACTTKCFLKVSKSQKYSFFTNGLLVSGHPSQLPAVSELTGSNILAVNVSQAIMLKIFLTAFLWLLFTLGTASRTKITKSQDTKVLTKSTSLPAKSQPTPASQIS